MKISMFDALMNSTTDSIVFSNLNGVYVAVSQKKAENWGLTRREMVGKSDYDFMPKQEADQARRDSLSVIESGQPIVNCIRKAIRNNETVWYSLSEYLWTDEWGNITGTISISRNITERERLREALFSFFGDAAHKLKSPLFSANGILSRIIRGRYGSIEDQSVINALKNVHSQYELIEKRACESLEHVATLSNINNEKDGLSNTERIDVARDVFDYLLEIHSSYLEENNVYIEGSMGLIPPNEVFVTTNLSMLRSVFEHFITNSVKYGKIGREKLNISYGYWYNAGFLFLNLYNDGEPINEEFIKAGLLCKPFERAEETCDAAEGSGLGMHIVENFMQMLGGGFKYEKTPTNHPNFIVWLPL